MSNEIISGHRVSVDVEQVNRLLTQLNDKDAKKAIKSAIRKSALIIRKEAQNRLVSLIPNANKSVTKKGTTYKPLKNDINLAVYRDAGGARIDLLNKRKKGARAYVLRFIELGTVERATKKGANRGTMKAYNFFSDAVNAKKKEAEDALQQNILDSINKVINKNK
ncbi:hypothetical protein [Bacteroides stercorirosoris]|jgi:hypothetical protein|uniref:Phage protein, HK97 gp10 family n=1 Tax=Bacteroides stercorirosoris TaxID=871324 RepID=A0A1M6EQT3_9BACE|nr:hypothetical protein [Bacteroides stercorirosoris]OKZ14431.1 MAG: hypothetical protein BHV75_01020 [Bacteroides oleiciplenus]SHI87803.1 hypothetical protein SAMN05444350_11017 [Bacteroides stercorirosoris]